MSWASIKRSRALRRGRCALTSGRTAHEGHRARHNPARRRTGKPTNRHNLSGRSVHSGDRLVVRRRRRAIRRHRHDDRLLGTERPGRVGVALPHSPRQDAQKTSHADWSVHRSHRPREPVPRTRGRSVPARRAAGLASIHAGGDLRPRRQGQAAPEAVCPCRRCRFLARSRFAVRRAPVIAATHLSAVRRSACQIPSARPPIFTPNARTRSAAACQGFSN